MDKPLTLTVVSPALPPQPHLQSWWGYLMTKTWHISIFIIVLVLVGLLSLIYSSKSLADLILTPLPADNFNVGIILRPLAGAQPEGVLVTAGQVVNRRLAQLNLSGRYVVLNQPGQLAVSLPNNDQTPYMLKLITHVGQIEFIDGGITPPLAHEVQTGSQADPVHGVYQLLFAGQEVEDVAPPDSVSGQIFYRLTLNSAAATRLTQTQTGHYICMVMDKQVIHCSSLYHINGNTLDILPHLASGTSVSLADLAIFLESGPLPAPLTIER
jgi:preprotein translocase subunit SecD